MYSFFNPSQIASQYLPTKQAIVAFPIRKFIPSERKESPEAALCLRYNNAVRLGAKFRFRFSASVCSLLYVKTNMYEVFARLLRENEE